MGSNDISAHVYERLISIISKPPHRRTDLEINQILSWFKKKSDLFRQLKDEIIVDIVKNCEFETDEKDDLIIKQGDEGECFFIILSGTVSIYINTNFGADDDTGNNYSGSETEVERTKSGRRQKPLDRSIYGNYVGKIDAGRSFGELALINADCIRNATIIADEKTDLVIVNRDLYKRSLHEFQAKDFDERKRFVDSHSMFDNWLPKYKKQMAMSLRREKILFDATIVRQGAPVDGIMFLLSGQVKLLMDSVLHAMQYPAYFPLVDPADLEKVQARELLRRELSISPSRLEDKKWSPVSISTPSVSSAMSATDSRCKLRSPQVSRHNIEVCNLGAFEIIGDLEAVIDLPTYCYTVKCTQEAEVFILDQKNYDRLIEKRNPKVIEILKESVREKYRLRLSWLPSKELPLIRHFLYQLWEEKRSKRDRPKKTVKKEPVQDWSVTNLKKGPLIDMFGPGSVFFLIRMKEKQRQLEKERYQGAKKRLQQTRPRNPQQTPPTVDTITYQTSRDSTFVSQLGRTSTMDSGLGSSKTPDRIQSGVDDDILCDDSGIESCRLVCESSHSRTGDSSPRNDFAFIDSEINENNLLRLEQRLEAWNNKMTKDSQRKRNIKPVKLPRYVHEGPLAPIPGKKVFIKPIRRKEIDIIETLKKGLDEDGSNTLSYREETPDRSAPPTASSVRIQTDTKKRRHRPFSVRFDQHPIIHRKRTATVRQYSAAEYEALKGELRRKQQSFKSILTRPQSAFA
ncbi:uncharacterized protein LOC125647883 isoform X2 [Ostrea edulis]|uniref:uncharacterized protein LOC125647883 isoform X2 n=1 Tax=Ostrea edulis TaxID=37623 RepID=UPI00209607C7|nr:uncharacterized protein LOC125647883 isoform X2 [Ostrea edulis]